MCCSRMKGSGRMATLTATLTAAPFRTFLFAALGLLVTAHGATRGRREWVLRYDGTFTRTLPSRVVRPGFTVTLGLGTSNAIASGATCALLLIALATSRRMMALPALVLAVGDMLAEVSDAVVATALLLTHSGPATAAAYAVFAAAVIAAELCLWRGVLSWYEEGLDSFHRRHRKRLREFTAPSAASSVSSFL